jgi:hypothetical protein
MGLTGSYLPRGTCCRQCLVFVSIPAAVLSGAEAAVVVGGVAEAHAMMVKALADEGLLLLAAALLGLLFPVQSTAA